MVVDVDVEMVVGFVVELFLEGDVEVVVIELVVDVDVELVVRFVVELFLEGDVEFVVIELVVEDIVDVVVDVDVETVVVGVVKVVIDVDVAFKGSKQQSWLKEKLSVERMLMQLSSPHMRPSMQSSSESQSP